MKNPAQEAEERKRVALETKRHLEEKAALQAELNKQAKQPVCETVNTNYAETSPGKEKLIAAIAKAFWTTNEIAERWLVEEFT